MDRKSLTFVFVALLLTGASFVISTTTSLPDRVASHFGAGGHANGYMTREGYRWFMLFFTVGFPALLWVLVISGAAVLHPSIHQYPESRVLLYSGAPDPGIRLPHDPCPLVRLFACALPLFGPGTGSLSEQIRNIHPTSRMGRSCWPWECFWLTMVVWTPIGLYPTVSRTFESPTSLKQTVNSQHLYSEGIK